MIKCWQRKGDHLTSSAHEEAVSTKRGHGLPGIRGQEGRHLRLFLPAHALQHFSRPGERGKYRSNQRDARVLQLNDSLRRLGLREVPGIPQKVASRTTEDIIRMAFHAMDPDVFPPPAWLLDVAAIDGRDADHATLLIERYAGTLAGLGSDREKHAFLQGVLDVSCMTGKA